MKKFCALTALALATLPPLASADVVIKTRTRVVVHRPVVGVHIAPVPRGVPLERGDHLRL